MDINTLQTIFYTLGIVFMGAILVLMIALVIAVFYIRAKITTMQRQIETKLMNAIDKPMKLATEVGAMVASKFRS